MSDMALVAMRKKWGTADTEIKALLLRTQSWQTFSILLPELGQNIAIHALLIANNVILILNLDNPCPFIFNVSKSSSVFLCVLVLVNAVSPCRPDE